MRRSVFPLLAALLLAGCGVPQRVIDRTGGSAQGHKPPVQTATKATDIPGMSSYALGEPIRSGNVTIVPVILRKDIKPSGDYITLFEAKKFDLIEIIEVPGEQQVDTLRVHNKAHRPLLLLGGELLLGGKQDRVVAADTVVPPYTTQGVQVYCVEHGRWTGPSEKFGYSDTMVPQKVRHAVTYDEQQTVWNEVGKYNSSAKASAGTSTVRAGVFSAQVQSRVKSGMSDVEKGLRANSNVVGAVLVMNGRIDSLELFGNTKLFSAGISPVLRGFLAQAAVEPSTSKKLVTKKECADFVRNTLNSRHVLLRTTNGYQQWDIQGDSSVRGRVLGGAGGAAAAKPGAPGYIHGSYSNEQGKSGGGSHQQQRQR